MKQKDINYNFIWTILIIGIFTIFNLGLLLWMDGRLDNLEEPEQSPCYVNVYEKTFAVGVPKGNGEYGYLYEDPTFRNGKNVEYIKKDLELCDGTRFVDLITEIYNQEKIRNDVLLGVNE